MIRQIRNQKEIPTPKTEVEIRNQKEIPTPKTEVGKKLNWQLIRYLYMDTYRKPGKQLFSNRRPLSYPNLTETMKTHIRFKQQKQFKT